MLVADVSLNKAIPQHGTSGSSEYRASTALIIQRTIDDGRPSDYQTEVYRKGLKGIKPTFPFTIKESVDRLLV